MTEQPELIPMATGEYLQKLRQSRKKSLAGVARDLCFDEELLRLIEAGQPLPLAPVYRQGYIRAYARYLGAPEDRIATLLPADVGTEQPLQAIFPAARKRNPADRWLRATSYVLASLLIGTLAWQLTHEAVRLSKSRAQLHAGQEADAEHDGVNAGEPLAEAPVNASIASLDILHGGANAGLEPAEQAWAAIKQPALREGASRLRLSVSADCWVEITDAESQELEMDLLRAGSEKEYTGMPPFRILFGHAPAVTLLVDGEQVDLAPFTHDDVAQMSWPQQEISELQ